MPSSVSNFPNSSYFSKPNIYVFMESRTSLSMHEKSLEYQRRQAKDIRAKLNDLKKDTLEQDSKILGFTPQNEITHGRWVMMGLAIGLLTEYATGVNFNDQIILS